MEALVSSPLCPLRLRPDPQSELADEALLGWTLDLLEEAAPGWYLAQTDYGYTGFVPADRLVTHEAALRTWNSLPHKTVLRGVCSLRSAPTVQSGQVSLLLRGSTLAVVGEPDKDGWQEAALPDGQRGYTKTGFLFHIPHSLPEDAFRAQVTAMGRLYRDTHYLWGGKSPLGMDCSGLTFMAYRLSGVTIWRDAGLKEGYPLRPIDFEAKKPGDLLFFPGHVALYLGEGRYLHSTAQTGSDGVVVNSLDPRDPDYRPDLPPSLLAVGSLF